MVEFPDNVKNALQPGAKPASNQGESQKDNLDLAAEQHPASQRLAGNVSEDSTPDIQEKEKESSRRAAREMRIAALTIVLACVGVCILVILVILIGHIQIF